MFAACVILPVNVLLIDGGTLFAELLVENLKAFFTMLAEVEIFSLGMLTLVSFPAVTLLIKIVFKLSFDRFLTTDDTL